jgi:hypothetical protein
VLDVIAKRSKGASLFDECGRASRARRRRLRQHRYRTWQRRGERSAAARPDPALLSKAFLLAADKKISDPTIALQISG